MSRAMGLICCAPTLKRGCSVVAFSLEQLARADTFAVYVATGEFGPDLVASTRLAMAESDMWPGLEPEAPEEEFEEPDPDEVLGAPPVAVPVVPASA